MMKDQYETDFFVLRSPMFPLNYGTELFAKIKEKGINILVDFLTDEVLDAIYLASPTLYSEIIKIKQGNVLDGSKLHSICLSLFKYLNRASARCTPFGLFANCSLGNISDRTNLQFGDVYKLKYLRLDMDFLCHFADKIKQDKSLIKYLNYSPNSTIYAHNKTLKYIEYRYSEKGDRTFHLSQTDKNNVIKSILSLSKHGISYQDLCRKLSESTDFPINEIEDYVNELIKNNILYSNIDPNVTGEFFFNNIKNSLSLADSDECQSLKDAINDIETNLSLARNNHSIIDICKKNKNILEQDLQFIDIDESKLHQVDSYIKNTNFQLDKSSINELIENINNLNSLNNLQTENYYLEKFKKAFYEKYENQSIRLVELFDNESGIGYRNAFSKSTPYDNLTKNSNLELLAIKKYIEFARSTNNVNSITITDEDLIPYQTSKSLPDEFSIMANVIMDNDCLKYIVTSVPSSTSNLLGRFCYLDEKFAQNVQKIIKKEENENSILAEIAHLPQSRVGNVLARPVFTDYEIEFLSRSTLSGKNKISIADLYVKLVNNEIILFSKSLKKRIIPKLSSAHNFVSASLEIYHFLCDLQFQNKQSVSIWNWGNFLKNEKYLPRVIYKNIILSLAEWRISSQDLVAKMKTNNTTFQQQLKTFITQNNIPKYVTFRNSDNYLVLDIENDISLVILEKECKKTPSLILYEFIYLNKSSENYSSALQDNDFQDYANEVIIPVNKKNRSNIPKAINKNWLLTHVNRDFYLGDEWFYLKIYSKAKFANTILEKISKLADQFIKNKLIEKWFFIRYSDPLPHIRVRFHKVKDYDVVIRRLRSILNNEISKGIISEILIDKYSRELERYGEDNITISENLFFISSQLVTSIYRKGKYFTHIDYQLMAAYVVDRFIDNFNFNLKEKSEFYNLMYKNFSNEFNLANNPNLKTSLNRDFRNKREILSHFDQDQSNTLFIRLVNKHMQSMVRIIKTKPDYETLFINSHIHMFLNRFFAENQRFEEFRIYHLLDSYYRYVIGRSKKMYKSI